MSKFFRFAFVCLIGLSAVSASAQLVVRDSLNNILNDDTIYVYSDTNHDVHKIRLFTTNESQVNKNVKLTRFTVDVPDSTENYFCWSLCYNAWWFDESPEFTDLNPVMLNPNVQNGDMRAYHIDNGNLGTATYKYVWEDADDSSDVAEVTIIFDIVLSVNELEQNRATTQLAPNPAQSITWLTYTASSPSAQTSVRVYDMLGNIVLQQRTPRQGGRVAINTSDLNAGIYFVSLLENGNVTATKKLVVDR